MKRAIVKLQNKREMRGKNREIREIRGVRDDSYISSLKNFGEK